MLPPESAVALQEAQVEPGREVQVQTQYQEKQNESYYCSIVGCGHMGSLETEMLSAWARQGSEVERHATVDMLRLLGASTETLLSRKGGQGRLEAFPPRVDTERPRGEYWGMSQLSSGQVRGLGSVPVTLWSL